MKIDITNNINFEKFSPLGSDMLSMPKTKIYAINKFLYEDRLFIVSLVEYNNPITGKRNTVTQVWDFDVLIDGSVIK